MLTYPRRGAGCAAKGGGGCGMNSFAVPFRPEPLREDLLVSACFGDCPPSRVPSTPSLHWQGIWIRTSASAEIVVVAEESRLEPTCSWSGASITCASYRSRRDGLLPPRVIAADEAIGDVVLLANAPNWPMSTRSR